MNPFIPGQQALCVRSARVSGLSRNKWYVVLSVASDTIRVTNDLDIAQVYSYSRFRREVSEIRKTGPMLESELFDEFKGAKLVVPIPAHERLRVAIGDELRRAREELIEDHNLAETLIRLVRSY